MEKTTQLPVEVVREINEQSDKYGFVVPYDGSNKFYNDDKVEGYKAGATAYATKLQDAQKENADLKRWKQEAIQLLAPIIEYGQGHKDAQLGRSCTEFVLQRAKLYDTLKAQPGIGWVKAVWGMIPDGIHSMKLVSKDNVVMRGTGLVANNAITLITFLNKTTMGEGELPENYEGVYYLDEIAAGREEVNKRVFDFVRDIAKNWDCDEDGHKYNTGCRKCDASELLNELSRASATLTQARADFNEVNGDMGGVEAVAFTIWCTDNYYPEYGYWWRRSSDDKYTIDQLYDIFKQQKEK